MKTLAAQVITPEDLLKHWQGHRALTRRVIEAFPEKDFFEFDAPKEKIEYYSHIIQQSKANAIFHELLPPADMIKDNEFLHFDILIDRRLFRRFFRKYRRLPQNLTFVPNKQLIWV